MQGRSPRYTGTGIGIRFPWTAIVWGGGAILFLCLAYGVMRNFRRRAERMSRPLRGGAGAGRHEDRRHRRCVFCGPHRFRGACLYLPVRRYKAEELSLIYLHQEQHRRQGISRSNTCCFSSGDCCGLIRLRIGWRRVSGGTWSCAVTKPFLAKWAAAQRLAYGEHACCVWRERAAVCRFPPPAFWRSGSLVKERIETVLRERKEKARSLAGDARLWRY